MRPDDYMMPINGERVKIRPLSLGQVRRLEKLLKSMSLDGGQNIGADEAIEVLKIALDRDHKELAANIEDQEIPLVDLPEVILSILKLGGLVKGEVMPPAASLLTGISSTEV